MTETDFATEDVAEAQPRNLKLWISTGVAAVAFIVLAIVFNSRFGVDPRGSRGEVELLVTARL